MNRWNLGCTSLVILALLWEAPTVAFAPDTNSLPSISDEFLVENWQMDEGLPRNTISSILQDSDRYLWLGTPRGLARFNGIRFAALQEDVSPELAQEDVRHLLHDPIGGFWIATRRSLLLRRGADGTITQFRSDLLPGTLTIDSIALDGQGTLWITRSDGRLLRLRGGQLQVVAELQGNAGGTTATRLVTDRNGSVWFYDQDTYGRIDQEGTVAWARSILGGIITLAPGHGGRMWLCTGTDLQVFALENPDSAENLTTLPFGMNSLTALYEDTPGTLWMGVRGLGLLRFQDGRLEKVNEIHQIIHTIQEDDEGNLWVGTEREGLFKLRARQFRTFHLKGTPANRQAISVCGDWVVFGLKGLGRINPRGGIDMIDRFAANNLTSVCEDGQGGLWLANRSGRLLHCAKDAENPRLVKVAPRGHQPRVLYNDSRSNLWVGCFPNKLFFVPAGQKRTWIDRTGTNFRGAAVNAIAEDRSGNIWIGTSNGEIHRTQGNAFVGYGHGHGLPGSPIGAMLFSRDGTLWIGTVGSGLGRSSPTEFKYASVPLDLNDDSISQLIEDDEGWLWIASARGLSRIHLRALQPSSENGDYKPTAVRFGRSDGLSSIGGVPGYQPSVWKTTSGHLRFATTKGIVHVVPQASLAKPPATLHLVRMVVDGVEVPIRKNVFLSHKTKEIEIHFDALSFTSPEKIRFKRRLDGFDSDWIHAGSERAVKYAGLPPGSYRFRLMARNSEGFWNEGSMGLTITVKPALWQTEWFRGGALLALVALTGGMVRYISTLRYRKRLGRLQQAHRLDEERARIGRDLHDDLGARLTQIALMTDLVADEAEATTETQNQLREVSTQARLAVRALDETVWMVDPQKDFLPHLVVYLGQYANEFFSNTNISCRQHICPNPPHHALPGEIRHNIFFAVKEAFNNILKHSRATRVSLSIGLRGSFLRIVIRDNGAGFNIAEMQCQGNGLENMKQRMRALGGRCSIRSKPAQGTQVRLLLKLSCQPVGKP